MSETLTKPQSVVVGPDDGASLWQPLPSRGYVTVKLEPDTMPYDTFSSGIQVLPPGCSVREHGHKQNHELIFVYEGRGTCTIDGVTHEEINVPSILSMCAAWLCLTLPCVWGQGGPWFCWSLVCAKRFGHPGASGAGGQRWSGGRMSLCSRCRWADGQNPLAPPFPSL